MLIDPRETRLAEVLLNATEVAMGDRVFLHCIGVESINVMNELVRLARERGALEVVKQLDIPEVVATDLKACNVGQAGFEPPHVLQTMKQMDVFIGVRALENSFFEADIDPEVMSVWKLANAKTLHWRVDHTRWCVTRIATQGSAQNAGKSLPDFENFCFNAQFLDYAELAKKHKKLMALMAKTDVVRILAPDTDISLSIKGMKQVSCHGDKNIPDGEVYTAPRRLSANGYITYNVPSPMAGQVFPQVKLVFKKGKIVEAEVPGNAKLTALLNKILDTDEGARYLGEFAVGTNCEITVPAVNILFDEKIFASIHLTPGMCYEDASNGNKSAIHWDLVKMFLPEYGGGLVLFDGVPVIADGIFVHPHTIQFNPEGTETPPRWKRLAAAKTAAQIRKAAKEALAA